MRIRSSISLLALPLLPGIAAAQTTPVEGLRQNPPGVHALVGARVVTAPGRVLENATVVIRDGVIEAVGANVRAPADARVWQLEGRTIYPGFIDAYADVGMPARGSRDDVRTGAVYWNPQVRSYVAAASVLTGDQERTAALRSQGFTAAMTVPRAGMFRGQSAVVSLGEGTAAHRVIRPGVAQALSLVRDTALGNTYPTSSMGAITFVRQTLHDADWHVRAHAAYDRNPAGLRRPESNAALAALAGVVQGNQPLIVEARTDEDLLRIQRFGEEFPLRLWIRGSGSEYRLLDALTPLRTPLILPLAYPDTPNVRRPEAALNVSLADLRHWYLAPENPARLAGAGVQFALTSDGLRDRRQFLPNLRQAVQRGLTPDAALAALTTTPAQLLGITRTHGTIEAGKAANLVVAGGDLFQGDGAAVQDVWVDGRRFNVESRPIADPRGRWTLSTAGGPERLGGQLVLEGTADRMTGVLHAPGGEVRLESVRVTDEGRRLQLRFPGALLGIEGTVQLTGSIGASELAGWGDLPDGRRVSWVAERVGAAPEGAGASGNGSRAAPRPLPHIALAQLRPAMEYGRARLPDQPQTILVRNATVWTMGPQGRLENADLLVRAGRVAQVGQNLQAPPNAFVIDATGKHVTPGLIDAHIHSGATGGINETGSAIVPEVRIGDVITIDNIDMYRQLAGGLTTAHVMHGSANPIGGQNQIVKLRWGALPEELKFQGAPRTVKFALGENPVRRPERYPDTRMGTEQIIRDHFSAAREYQRSWREWERNRQGIPPRRDLRLEAIGQILDGEILVMSHGYRQDEMLMLMRLAEEFGFRVKGFHHAVEAYKIAPEIAAHGAAAFVWSDWGAFKVEAYDNTTYNARVLTEAGVLTSLHSDNAQLAARMNWEAGKMLRTGLSEVDALALVTINTARGLGIDSRVGSLEPGKDGDFVIWSGNPLSTTTRAEQTWIDGRKFFDLVEDQRLRQEVERERALISQAILAPR